MVTAITPRMAMRGRGVPGLVEIELVLAELERDALARCGAERALVP